MQRTEWLTPFTTRMWRLCSLGALQRDVNYECGSVTFARFGVEGAVSGNSDADVVHVSLYLPTRPKAYHSDKSYGTVTRTWTCDMCTFPFLWKG